MRSLLSLLTVLAIISSSSSAQAMPTPEWHVVATAENGEVYSYDANSIAVVETEGMVTNLISITVDNFKGYPGTDHLWAQIAVLCSKPAYRNSLALARKEGSKELVTMPLAPSGKWSTSKDGTPMTAIMQKACNK